MTTKLTNILIGVLLIFLPISNFLGQIGTNILGLPIYSLLWKELIVGIIILVMVFDIIKKIFETIFRRFVEKLINKTTIKKENSLKEFLPIILYLIIIGFILFSSITNRVPLNQFWLGFRFELFWVGFLVVCMTWVNFGYSLSLKKLKPALDLGFVLLNIIIASSLYFGADKFYSRFGYSSGWSSINNLILESPLCHSIDSVGGGCRLSGGFNNPNHLAGYLLLVIPIFLYYIFDSKNSILIRIINLIFVILALGFGFLTYARYAFVAVIVIILLVILKQVFKNNYLIKAIVTVFLLLNLIVLNIGIKPQILEKLPSYLAKSQSTLDHYRYTNLTLDIIVRDFPSNIALGYGLGQAGTAAKPQYQKDILQSPIVLKNQDLAKKYNLPAHQLPNPENWFLQVIQNGGILYGIVYMLIILMSLQGLFREEKIYGTSNQDYIELTFDNNTKLAFYVSLGLLTIVFGNTGLHIWESSVIALLYPIIYLFANDKS